MNMAETKGSEEAKRGARQMALVVSEFFKELRRNGVPIEEAGIITAEFAKVIVARSMGEHERKTK